jgi:hypothetical protein
MDFDAITVALEVERERQRLVESVRVRCGGVYDRILGRFVRAEEVTSPAYSESTEDF